MFDLSAESYNILSDENDKTAVTFLEQSIDLVLLDINLPDTDGFLLCCMLAGRDPDFEFINDTLAGKINIKLKRLYEILNQKSEQLLI